MDAVLKVVPLTTEPDVLEARQKEEGGAPSPQAPDSGEQAARTPNESDDDAAIDDEPPADATPLVRKKINKLLRQRRELRDQVVRLEPDANIGGQLSNFARENDLSPDDITRAVSLAASIRRGDWHGFYNQVAPYVRKAQEYLGLVLPEDLGQRVQQGHMSEVAAREFARTRFDHDRAQLEARTTQQRNDAQRVEFVQADVQRAVTTFEERLAASDPDYRAKADAIRRATQALLFERGGRISSVKEALDIVQAAHSEVTSQFRRLIPQPRATSPSPSGHSQQPNARAAPKSLMEAALAGLETSRRSAG
jgi:hypothetical protein